MALINYMDRKQYLGWLATNYLNYGGGFTHISSRLGHLGLLRWDS